MNIRVQQGLQSQQVSPKIDSYFSLGAELVVAATKLLLQKELVIQQGVAPYIYDTLFLSFVPIREITEV